MGPRRNNAKYTVATYRRLTREVYKIEDWYPVKVDGKVRWGFNGIKASDEIEQYF